MASAAACGVTIGKRRYYLLRDREGAQTFQMGMFCRRRSRFGIVVHARENGKGRPTINEKTIADFTRVVEQTGILEATWALTDPRPDDAKPSRAAFARSAEAVTEPGAEALGLIWRAAGAYSEDGDNCPMQLRRRVQTH